MKKLFLILILFMALVAPSLVPTSRADDLIPVSTTCVYLRTQYLCDRAVLVEECTTTYTNGTSTTFERTRHLYSYGDNFPYRPWYCDYWEWFPV